MTRLRVGFRAFDSHELLTHFVAERAGLYRERDIEVELVDLRRERHPHDASVACGTALFDALDGQPIEILLVASAAPLFWLYGRGPVRGCARVATYPKGAPPARFLELGLGFDLVPVPARDDAARLALVNAGEADCALISSATPPTRVSGLSPQLCLADRVRIPSTGLAAPRARNPAIADLVDAHRRALVLLALDPALGRAAAREAFGFTEHEAGWAIDVGARYFTRDGRVSAEYVEAALRTVGARLCPYAATALSDG